MLLYCTWSKSSLSSSQYNLIPSQIKRNTVFSCSEKRNADTYNTTPICLLHCTHLKSHHRTRQTRNERSEYWNAVLCSITTLLLGTSAHLIACRTTELRIATRSAARLSRYVGSTVSCGEWEERKRWEVSENGIHVLWAVYAARCGSCPPSRGSVRFFKFSTALKII